MKHWWFSNAGTNIRIFLRHWLFMMLWVTDRGEIWNENLPVQASSSNDFIWKLWILFNWWFQYCETWEISRYPHLIWLPIKGERFLAKGCQNLSNKQELVFFGAGVVWILAKQLSSSIGNEQIQMKTFTEKKFRNIGLRNVM